MTNREIVDSVWATTNEEIKYMNIHDFTGKACDMIMKQSINQPLRSITVLLV